MDHTHTTTTSNRIARTGIEGYSRIKITNETPHTATGIIVLTSSLKNTYAVTSNQTWEARERELSLLTSITAILTRKDGSTIQVSPYIASTASGTGFSRFSIVNDQNGYRVVRNML